MNAMEQEFERRVVRTVRMQVASGLVEFRLDNVVRKGEMISMV